MGSVVPTDVSPLPCPPKRPERAKPRRVVCAFAVTLAVFALVVVACSGDDGGAYDVEKQSQAARCGRDDCPDPPGPEPCGIEGEACCRFGNRCQAGLVCDATGTCSTCGGTGAPCCANNTCSAGNTCSNGTCARNCGLAGLQCCSTGPQCDPNLVCSGGTCNSCGRGGQACCANNSCNGGFNCTSGTCTACGSNGQACCASGATCGLNLYCATGNVCRPIPCGYDGGPCCQGFPSQQCSLAGPGFACNTRLNRCERCGGTGQVCCASGFPCSSGFDVCETSGFNAGTCQHCGRLGEACCPFGTACTNGVCGSNGRCQSCGGRFQPCCSGNLCGSGTCVGGMCQ